MTATVRTTATETLDWSDPELWEMPGQRHPWEGKRVRYMGREWYLAGCEFTVQSVDEFSRCVCESSEYPGQTIKIPLSMLDLI